jgi:hypothetical protein
MTKFDLTQSQLGVWFTIETLLNPDNTLFGEAGYTGTQATAGSRQRRVSTSGPSVSGPILRKH